MARKSPATAIARARHVSGPRKPSSAWRLLLILVTVWLLAYPGLAAQPGKVQVFTPQVSYTIDTIQRNGLENIGLLELFDPLGQVEARVNGKLLRLSFSSSGRTVNLEFRDGQSKVRINNVEIDLSSRFSLISGRGYLPISAALTLLPRVTDLNADFNPATHRLLLGNAATKFSMGLQKNPSRLVISFLAPVSPTINAEGNVLRITFPRDTVVSTGNDNLNFDDPQITAAAFVTKPEARIFVKASGPLRADVDPSRKIITVTLQNPQLAAPVGQQPAQPSTSQKPQPAPSAVPGGKGFVVVLDASHGGADAGATLTDKLLEKDVTLAFARKISHELTSRGIAPVMIRTGDNEVSADQRAVSTNANTPRLYITIHASSLGRGLRVFSAFMKSAPAAQRGAFLPWKTAQASFLDRSFEASAYIASGCSNKNLPVRALTALVQPIASVAAPAVAIELAPRDGNVASINAADYQQSYAMAIAGAIVALRSKQDSGAAGGAQ